MSIFEKAIEEANKRPLPEDVTYIDGMAFCANCGKPLTIVRKVFGEDKTLRVMCECEQAELDKRKLVEEIEERERRRSVCFGSAIKLKEARFETAEPTEFTEKAQKYCRNFEKHLHHDHMGLMLYGSNGTGKSYLASMICNELIDRGYTALVTNLSRIAHLSMDKSDRKEYLRSLSRYSLIVLDDLGTERDTSYMNEIIFDVIDTRYETGKPMIITTNLSPEYFRSSEASTKRVADRLRERCITVNMTGESFRRKNAIKNYRMMKEEEGW